MMALGFTTRYSGLDATLGLAFAGTGVLYPFFGTMLGWLGVALTGSDTSSNVLFGSLQRITAEQLGLSPMLMAAANSSGGVMGKMIDAQSIVVASTATRWYGHEGEILRYVFWHSLVLGRAGGRARDAAGLRLAVHAAGLVTPDAYLRLAPRHGVRWYADAGPAGRTRARPRAAARSGVRPYVGVGPGPARCPVPDAR